MLLIATTLFHYKDRWNFEYVEDKGNRQTQIWGKRKEIAHGKMNTPMLLIGDNDGIDAVSQKLTAFQRFLDS